MFSYKSAVWAALFLLILIILLGLWFPQSYTLVKIEESHKGPNTSCVIRPQQFQLQWQHSVEKTRWQEHYQREDQHFILTHTDLVSFGAGTPDHYPVLRQANGQVRMQVNHHLKELHWTISRRMQGQLQINQKRWPMAEDFPDYTVVHFSVQQRPFWKWWGQGDCV
ncbi:DUF1850 domain-containing protein [Acinetobacter indicus]|uniref:DUF1850 domain-containing protein n=1 Tax=Acinetobacter indicus TaxID=756892 RepID=UPI000CEB584A|nr:DUF1850 domain-containing protein [Acinetobacter indicus]AVH13514.1 DUF1850 domain-containing protein [Acinetobacter indicus]